MDQLDFTKRDMTVAYGGRVFALRAYRHGGAWHGLIIEDRTPLHASFAPALDAAACFAAAVGFVAALVDGAVETTPRSP
ncbi:MAG: hypothetical protein K0S78_489 [Thermomicrobiales bacterium]|jgi:hypothetical protein|nr:hypothetical protein [Thermomicrobiales bacterium]